MNFSWIFVFVGQVTVTNKIKNSKASTPFFQLRAKLGYCNYVAVQI